MGASQPAPKPASESLLQTDRKEVALTALHALGAFLLVTLLNFLPMWLSGSGRPLITDPLVYGLAVTVVTALAHYSQALAVVLFGTDGTTPPNN